MLERSPPVSPHERRWLLHCTHSLTHFTAYHSENSPLLLPPTLLLSVTAATQKKQFISVRIQSTSSKNWDAESFHWLWRLIDQQQSAWKGPNWMNSDHEWTSWLLRQEPKSIEESKQNKQTNKITLIWTLAWNTRDSDWIPNSTSLSSVSPALCHPLQRQSG